MKYTKFKTDAFFRKVTTEKKARDLLWKVRFDGRGFECPRCQGRAYYPIKNRPEVRQCQGCRYQTRLRAGTIFEASKKPLLMWLKAIYFVTQGKRGISAMELKRHLGLNSYQTAWAMLHKIREALRQRDDRYKLKGTVEVDGAVYGRRKHHNQKKMLVAVEIKTWTDREGRHHNRAGFAKALMGRENKEDTTEFAQRIKEGSITRTDGNVALKHMPGLCNDYHKIPKYSPYARKKGLDTWLPWVHKLITNTKAWIQGTHHGIGVKYLQGYISEYLYRFNRRHDLDGLFLRALTACTLAQPKTYAVLFR